VLDNFTSGAISSALSLASSLLTGSTFTSLIIGSIFLISTGFSSTFAGFSTSTGLIAGCST